MTLSMQLKNSTQDLHTQIEKHDWVRQLYQGELSLARYQYYLIELWAVYNCLEALLKENDELKLYLPELLRSHYIKQNLDGMLSQDNQVKVSNYYSRPQLVV